MLCLCSSKKKKTLIFEAKLKLPPVRSCTASVCAELKTFERIPTEILYKTELEQMVKPYATESFLMLPPFSSNSKSDSNLKIYLNSQFRHLYYFFMFLVHSNVNV